MARELTDSAIHAMNAHDWQLAKEFGEAHGFGFMIQVAAEEWARKDSMGRENMAFWLRSFADGLSPLVDASPSEATGGEVVAGWPFDIVERQYERCVELGLLDHSDADVRCAIANLHNANRILRSLASAPPAGDGVPEVRPDDVEYVKGCAERAQAWIEKQGAMVVPEDITLRDRLVRLTAALSYCATRQPTNKED